MFFNGGFFQLKQLGDFEFAKCSQVVIFAFFTEKKFQLKNVTDHYSGEIEDSCLPALTGQDVSECSMKLKRDKFILMKGNTFSSQ